MTKVMIAGLSGRMGQEIKSLFDSQQIKDLELIGGQAQKPPKMN